MSALDAYLKRPAKGGATRTTTGQQLGSSGVNPATLANVEELKTETDIPFFNDPQSELQYASAWTPDAPSDRTDVGCTPERDPELELDDSYTDSDYGVGGSGSGSCSAANSYYQSPTPSNSDIMLRPPSNSSLQHSQPSPGSSVNGAGYTYSQALQPPPPPSQRTAAGAAQAVASTPSSSSPFYHPNMWYPNAPYGNGSGSGNAYNRYAGYAVPLASGSVATAAAFAHGMLPHHVHHHSQQHHSHPHAGMHPHPHPLPPHHQLQHPHETMMEMFQLSNSGREARNRAEKNRRDKLNGSIQELSTMVPHVAESPRRVDKTAVLRFAAHGLRLKYVFGKTLHDHKPQVTDTLMGMLDSFFLTLTCHGQILLISSSIEHHLGHCQTDLYGQSILQIAHPDDHEMLKQQLIPNDLENLFEAHTEQTDDDGEPRQRSKSEEDYIDRKLRDDRRSFRVRLARAGPRSEPTAYEVVKIDGCFRRSDEAPRSVRSNTLSSSLQLIRRSRGRDDAIPLHTISGNDIVLTACARIIRPPKIANRLFDANTLEYRTRHLIDGRIIDCDQRIGIVAGYMTDEVRNLNPFTFMHNDDVRWVIVALRQMYDCNSSYGESTYRLFTRNGNIIYLQSKGYLEIDKETNRVHSFVCVNTLLDDEEGKRRVQEMKKKFSVIINTQIPQSTLDVPASEHPAQLEKAVLRLIHNLKSNDNDDHDDDDDDDVGDCDDDDDGDEDGDIEDGIASIASSFNFDSHPNPHQSHSHSHSHHSRSHRNHSYLLDGSMSMARMSNSKTPPLALVPPETSSVKSSISKSVSVVNVTAAKHLRGLHSATSAISAQASSAPASFTSSTTSAIAAAASERSTSTLIFDPSCSCLGDGDCDYCLTTLTSDATATLKRSSRGQDAPDNDNLKLPKRRFMPSTDIEHVINNSLQQIQRDLHQQMNVAAQLRDQSNRYELPDTSQRIDEIMEEHLKQSKQYVNIKNDFEEQLQTKANTTKTVRESDTQSSNTRGTGGGGGDATN